MSDVAERLRLSISDFCARTQAEIDDLRRENDRLRAAIAPFLRYLEDIQFNLRKQPRPTDAAIEEKGERIATVTWAEFYALRRAINQLDALESV